MKNGLPKIGSLLLLVSCGTAPPSGPKPPSAYTESLAACFAAQSRLTPFSGIAAAQRGGDTFVEAAGTTDGTAAHARDLPYRLASVGKLFTQASIGRLVDQGRIRLDAPIGTYLPGLPAAIAAATVEQLVQHRAGVAPMLLLTPDLVAARMRARTARDLVLLVAAQPLAFPPGTQVQYSNGGYFLLGAIIEAVSGRSYADYLQAGIFAPLGMTGSGLAATRRTPPAMTRMQEPGAPPLDAPAPMQGFPDLPGTAAGDSVGTIDDLLRLGRALAGSGFISDATKARLFPRRGPTWRIGQGGGRPGANAYFMAYPETGSALVVLTNQDPPAGELMGEVLGGVISGGPCRPLSEADRPSPLRMRRPSED